MNDQCNPQEASVNHSTLSKARQMWHFIANKYFSTQNMNKCISLYSLRRWWKNYWRDLSTSKIIFWRFSTLYHSLFKAIFFQLWCQIQITYQCINPHGVGPCKRPCRYSTVGMAFTTTFCFMRGKAPPPLPWTYMMAGQINQSPRYSPALNVIFCQTNTWTTPLLLNNVTKHFRHFV